MGYKLTYVYVVIATKPLHRLQIRPTVYNVPFPKLHPGPCSTVEMRRGTETHRRSWPICISPWLCFTRNVITCTIKLMKTPTVHGLTTAVKIGLELKIKCSYRTQCTYRLPQNLCRMAFLKIRCFHTAPSSFIRARRLSLYGD